MKGRSVLYLAYYFPPVNEIAAVRSWNTARQLRKRGWAVTVVTPAPDLWRRTERPAETAALIKAEGIRMLHTGHRLRHLPNTRLCCKDNGLWRLLGGMARILARRARLELTIGWLPELRRAMSVLDSSEFNLVLATGGPFFCFKVARDTAQRLKSPYVVDYRDLWRGNPHLRYGTKALCTEARVLADAAAVTVVSPGCRDYLIEQFRFKAKPNVVTNGYCPEELANVKASEFGHFSIVYTGLFYPPKRSIGPIMAAMRQLRQNHTDHNDFKFHYYGPDKAHVQEQAIQYGVEDRILMHGQVARAEALAAVKGASLALVITSVERHPSLADQGILTGKLFEAIGLGSPLLLIAPPESDAARLVHASQLGAVFNGADVDLIADYLHRCLVHGTSRRTPPAEYSWPVLGQRLDSILSQVLS